MDVLLMSLGSAVLALGALANAIVVHAIGIGRIAPSGAAGLPGRKLRASATAYRDAHRAATPLTWLTCTVAAVAAAGAIPAGATAGVNGWAVLIVLSIVVLVVGLCLATWRAHASVAVARPERRDD